MRSLRKNELNIAVIAMEMNEEMLSYQHIKPTMRLIEHISVFSNCFSVKNILKYFSWSTLGDLSIFDKFLSSKRRARAIKIRFNESTIPPVLVVIKIDVLSCD